MKPILAPIAALALCACESVSRVHDDKTGLTFHTFRDTSALNAQSIGQEFTKEWQTKRLFEYLNGER